MKFERLLIVAGPNDKPLVDLGKSGIEGMTQRAWGPAKIHLCSEKGKEDMFTIKLFLSEDESRPQAATCETCAQNSMMHPGICTRWGMQTERMGGSACIEYRSKR